MLDNTVSIATDKRGYPHYFSYFSTKTYVVGTYNIFFRREIRKISASFGLKKTQKKNALSVAKLIATN